MSEQLRVAFVLWGGHLGGAERHTVEICRVLRSEYGTDAGIVFVEQAGRSAAILDGLGIPWVALGLNRGRSVLRYPRKVADAVRSVGADVAFLGYGGYLARALRVGGYSGALASVEHGGILQLEGASVVRRGKEALSRAIGEHGLDGTVCVSQYVREEVLGRVHAPDVRVIYNGVDTSRYTPAEKPVDGIVFGHAARLIEGKGILQIVEAFDPRVLGPGARLLIAGEGPAKAKAQEIVAELGRSESVEFCGLVEDMPAFWRRCSVGVQPTTLGWKESFCLSIVEAMATGLPAIVSTAGALPEIVDDAGIVVRPVDVPLLAEAMRALAHDPEIRRRDGERARRRAVEHFDIRRAAGQYLEFAEELHALRA